jgi:glycosyltransferase involved in cell wall biosynthesis
MKLLVIAPSPYSDKSSHGGGVYCAQQLRELSKYFEIHFVTSGNVGSIDFVRKYAHQVYLSPIERKYYKQIILFSALLNFRPTIRPHTRKFAKLLNDIVASSRPDAALVQFPKMASCVDLLSDIPCLMDVQDVYSLSKKRRIHAENTILRKLEAYFIWLAWKRYESQWYPKYNKLLTLSENDTDALCEMGLGRLAVTTPTAIDIPEYYKQQKASNRVTMGFLGWFGRNPNADAAITLLEKVYPAVKEQYDDIDLVLAGRYLPRRLVNYCGSKHIKYLGFVERLEDFFNQIDIFVAPLRYGGGIKIKVLQALAYGCPTITTPIGAEGIADEKQPCLIVNNDIASMVHSIVKLARDQDLRYKLGKSGRSFAENNFSWSHKGGFLHDRITEVVQNS